MALVPKNKRNHITLLPFEVWSLNAQKIAMPKKMARKDGNPKTTIAAKRIPNGILAGEEFMNCGTPGIERIHANAKALKITTAEQRNRIEAAFDSSQLNLIHLPSHAANWRAWSFETGPMVADREFKRHHLGQVS